VNFNSAGEVRTRMFAEVNYVVAYRRASFAVTASNSWGTLLNGFLFLTRIKNGKARHRPFPHDVARAGCQLTRAARIAGTRRQTTLCQQKAPVVTHGRAQRQVPRNPI